MSEFIKSYGTLILAILGIVQVWMISLWKKYLRKGKLEIYETGFVEIGFSNFGATCNIMGTIRAIHSDQFINSIGLILIREKDKAEHRHRWLAFRPPIIEFGGNKALKLELASGFLVAVEEPHKFNLLFFDDLLYKEFDTIYNAFNAEWTKVVGDLKKIWIPFPGMVPQPGTFAELQNRTEIFRKSQQYLDAYTALDRIFYWEPGTYELEFAVNTSKPNQHFVQKYSFAIQQSDSDRIRLNGISILEDTILSYFGIPRSFYHSAYCKLIRQTQ